MRVATDPLRSILNRFLHHFPLFFFPNFPNNTRPRQIGSSLRHWQESCHQDHQSRKTQRIRPAESESRSQRHSSTRSNRLHSSVLTRLIHASIRLGGTRNRHHEVDRASPRPRPLRRLREQEISVSETFVTTGLDLTSDSLSLSLSL